MIRSNFSVDLITPASRKSPWRISYRSFRLLNRADFLANATLSDAEHNATLISMTTIFADVMDTNHLLGVIERSAKPALALAS